MSLIEGMVQEVQYDPETSQTSRLYYRVKEHGRDFASDAVPTIEINEPGGDELVAATNMTWTEADSGTAFLDYDAVSVALTEGLVVTGGTSTHTGTIAEINVLSASAGVIKLTGITGTFQDNETLTDTGSGSVTVAGTAHTAIAYYDLDASNTTNYDAAESYRADVVYTASTLVERDSFFFDVVMYPFGGLLVSSDKINEVHPDWIRRHPSNTGDWREPIECAHAEIARRIRAGGRRARCIVKREELYPYELAFAEAEIAARISKFTVDERNYWSKRAQDLWASKAEFAYEDDDDPELDQADGTVLLSGTKLTR